MTGKRIVLLDGTPADNEGPTRLLALLQGVLHESGAVVTTFTLRDIRMTHCIGCFGCWVETPGICIAADAGREIAEAVMRSETTILFTPITCGGYSSALKKCIDRWLPLIMPYFYKVRGEIHHTPRYAHYPRLVGIGVQSRPDAAEARLFKVVVGRNAINFHAPSFAADVVIDGDPPDSQRERMRSLLTRMDVLPFGTALTSITPRPAAFGEYGEFGEFGEFGERSAAAKRALLIIGSPKVKSPSSSGVLGSYLLDRLKEHGWQTDTLTLSAALLREKGEGELLAAADRADLLVLAFPLYIDALPFLVTRALEAIAAHRRSGPHATAPRLIALCNNGFPEAHQNGPALAICRQFALQCKISWAGSLALGAGEALCSGEPLSARGSKAHPPTKHVMQALDLTAAALAKGQPVPGEAQKLLEKCPIPLIPFSVWSWLFSKLGGRQWRRRAALLGVDKRNLPNRPYGS